MVRQAAQMRTVHEKITNGHGPESVAQEMDLDLNGTENSPYGPSDTAGAEPPAELAQLEDEMLEYGQLLQAQYSNDHRKEVTKALMEIWSLVAYPNPLREPQVSHLLDKKGRVSVAEDLNSAILCKFPRHLIPPRFWLTFLKCHLANPLVRHWRHFMLRQVSSWTIFVRMEVKVLLYPSRMLWKAFPGQHSCNLW